MKTTSPSHIRRPSSDFRAFVRKQLDARKARNPGYSLRAFARQLGLDHSTLSQVLRGRRPLTDKSITRLGQKLGLGPELIAPFLAAKPKRQTKAVKTRPLTLERFEVISQWQHAAILELTRVRGFKADSRWIAKALALSVHEVNVALARLLQLGLLEMAGRNRWIDRSGDLFISHAQLTEVALQKMHRESYELALRAVDEVPLSRRDQSALTVALNTKRLPQLLELVGKFREDLEAFARTSDEKDDVYQLEISLFPLTTLNHLENTDAEPRDAVADADQGR